MFDSKQEAFPVATSTSSNGNSMSIASNSSYTPSNQHTRRVRTRELSAGSPSPPWPTRDLARTVGPNPQLQQQDQHNMNINNSSTTTDATLCLATAGLEISDYNNTRSSSSKRPSARHNRSPSATLTTDIQSRSGPVMRSNGASSQDSDAQTPNRRSVVPTSPPNAWLQRSINNKIESPSTQPTILHNRGRSGSDGYLLAGLDQSPSRRESQLASLPSSNSLSNFRRSLSRRSISGTSSQGGCSSGTVADPLDPRGQLVPQQYRSDMSLESLVVKDKRKLFGRREDRSSSAASSNKGIVRKVNSRTFFGLNKEKSMDANTSSDTLDSVSTTSTARMELAKRAGDVLSRTATSWTLRSNKNGPIKHDDANAQVEGIHEEDFTNDAEDDLSILTPRGDGSQTSTHLPNNLQGTAINGGDMQDRGEGLPKRLSGWINNILATSTSSPDGRSEHLSASDSHTTVRRKSSALSLSRNDSNDRIASLKPGPSSSNGSRASTSRSRNAGLLSSLSGRARGEAAAASNLNSLASRTGLDRALRYFVDSGDQQQNQEEGIWLLGVWHGPEYTTQEALQISSEGKQHPIIAVTNPPPDARFSRSSTLDNDKSSVSRIESDLEADDTSTEDNSSRRTRETSPAASASTGGSISRASKVQTPEDSNIIARNPPTPQASKTSASFATPTGVTSNALLSTRQMERSQATNSSNASYMSSFQSDFNSRIWCTYRSQFTPISRDGIISSQAEMAAADVASTLITQQVSDGIDEATIPERRGEISNGTIVNQFGQVLNSTVVSTQGTLGTTLGIQAGQNTNTMTASLSDKMGIPTLWSRATAAAQSYGLGGRSGLTTDAGWGCMLRTGQSVLANALLNVHLGRDWRRKFASSSSRLESKRRKDYAKYVELLSWFMDEPSLACPFGVHRMAREGKRLGKEVGEWFGPSTAAGAIKKLVDEFPEAGMGVNLASDGVIYLDQVRAQMQSQTPISNLRDGTSWTRPVLVLIGIRLGLEGIHPMYHDSIKATFSFPHSVGIAGGRPSSSYYFMGYQGNSLFYLDPHHVRGSVTFRHPPPNQVDLTSWWLQAYSDAELSTFHNDRPRRMPMKSLDPSMLLGFLIIDEESLQDFVTRVKMLPRPIFSVSNRLPKWMKQEEEATLHDEDMVLESFSESSLDDGIIRDGEVTAMETLRSGDSDEDIDMVKGQKQDSIHSNTLATPRSESTFEFVDRQQPTALSPRPRPRPSTNRRSVGNIAQDKNDVRSMSESDADSTWEEVGADNLQRKEGDLSSPVEAAFPGL